MRSKVSIVRCRDYSQPEVFKAVRHSLDLIGGISDFVQPGQRVLIKPNLLSASSPESGVDTHPEVVRAIVRLVNDFAKTVLIGDSPGGYRESLDEVYERSGIKEVAEEEGARLVKFDRSEQIKGIPIASITRECDVLISVPKLKTHNLITLTLAVKNIFGVVPGLFKSECHRRVPNPDDFSGLLVDIFSHVKPTLSILDGVVAMEGEGPAAGKLRNLGLIMASRDAVALDAVVSTILGLDPFDIPTTKEAHRRGIGCGDLTQIEVIGEPIEAIKVEEFKLPRMSILGKIPKPIFRYGKWLIKFRPSINRKKCNRCGLCQKSCPQQSIEISPQKTKIDYSKCILCLCCQELCPNGAIYIERSWLLRMVGM